MGVFPIKPTIGIFTQPIGWMPGRLGGFALAGCAPLSAPSAQFKGAQGMALGFGAEEKPSPERAGLNPRPNPRNEWARSAALPGSPFVHR